MLMHDYRSKTSIKGSEPRHSEYQHRMVLVDALSAREAALKAISGVWFVPDRALLSTQRSLLAS
ncbi:hypothetical protein HGRIS_003192 [Hohenbuehelia grisea]|uniref:Uncharacterized protein n=1 Tax=Hohenbuehelia grisea TaxID=104357 RepID=A0ABR3JNA6_9AGAR